MWTNDLRLLTESEQLHISFWDALYVDSVDTTGCSVVTDELRTLSVDNAKSMASSRPLALSDGNCSLEKQKQIPFKKPSEANNSSSIKCKLL